MSPDATAIEWWSVGATLGAALVGGFFTLFATLWTLKRSLSNERAIDAEKRRANQAMLAYSAFIKLKSCYEELHTYELQVSAFFAKAEEEGRGQDEPWTKVAEMVGYERFVDPIDPDETSFLLDADRVDLLDRAHTIQRRAWNITAQFKRYTELRLELDTFLIENSVAGGIGEGTVIQNTLEGPAVREFRMRENRLNNLLGQVIQALEEDDQEALRVANDFQAVASDYFGDLFPGSTLGQTK